MEEVWLIFTNNDLTNYPQRTKFFSNKVSNWDKIL